MMSVVCDGRKELPAEVSREYSSYCGNYTYDGEKLVTRVDAASDPSRIGSDQVGPASGALTTTPTLDHKNANANACGGRFHA